MRYVTGRDSRQMAMGVWSVEDEVARALIALLVVYSMMTNGVHGISTEIDPAQIRAKGWLCVTLAFGAFFYPTY